MKWLQNILVGILFFGALAVVGYFTIVSESGPFAPKGFQLVLFFENADGIKVGNRVTVLGVPAGTVFDVALVNVDADNHPVDEKSAEAVAQRVAITVKLKRPVVFYENYSVSVKNESLLSGKIIAIDPGSARPEPGGKPNEIVPVLSVAEQELADKGQTALAYQLSAKERTAFVDIHGVTTGDPFAGLSKLIDENREDVRRTVNNIAEITGKINEGRGTLGLLVNDDQLHKNANTLVSDAQVVVKELREGLEDTREQAPVTSFIRAMFTAF